MRFRWKLLILLIVIAVVPIAAMRTFGVHSARSLADQLTAQARDQLIRDARSRLAFFVDSYSQLLRRKRLQLEMALAVQAEEISRVLAADAPAGARLLRPADFNFSNRARLNLISSPEHASSADPERKPVPLVSYEAQVFYLPSGGLPPEARRTAEKLTAVTPILARIADNLEKMALWHCTVLEAGITAVYPGHGGLTGSFDGRQQPWYRRALTSERLWSGQFRDPLSGRSVLALSMPVRDRHGSVIGVTALIIPISRLLENRQILKHLPAATRSYLVALVDNPESGETGVRILARQAPGNPAAGAWQSSGKSDWLVADDPAQQASVLEDFKAGRSNVRRIRYNNCDCLWVYGPVHQQGYLLLTTPYHQILAPVRQTEDFIKDQLDRLLGVTRYGILAILAVVILLALAFARTVTKPMQILADGAQRLARGKFDTRVDIRSNDEFGEMGRVFNAVGPQLESHWRLQQTLEVARELQQHLLPRRAPEIAGLDIAGRSIYSEKIGGDYFDYIDAGDGSDKIVVVVGDVSGHGIPSALLMTTARALLRQRISLPGDIRQIVADVNLRLCRDIEESGQFMTLFYAELAPAEKTLRWVRAGHDPALLYHPDTGDFEQLMGEGTTLGVSCDVHFEEHRQRLRTGEILLLYTDGVREARNPDGDMFGEAPMRRVVREHHGESAERIVAAILSELDAFRGSQNRREDDTTLVVVKVK